jgi:hypothetical protein
MRFLRVSVVTLLVAVHWATRCMAAPDGTYVGWAAQAWGSDRASAAPLAGRLSDPDGDGLPNFLEYALGLDPTQPDAERSPRWQGRAERGPGELTLAYRAPIAAREASVRPEWSRALGTTGWSGPDGTRLTERLIASTAADTLREARLNPAPGEPQLFARLRAEEVTAAPRPRGYVWFEAEPPNGESNPLLSGGQMSWTGPGARVTKNISVPADGTYTLWVRRFWNPQGFRWRVGTGAWATVAAGAPMQDLVDLGPGRKVGWINAGAATLTAGARSFQLEVTDTANTTAYDCFLLTREPFSPRGRLKPDELLSVNEPGWFAFQPENDPFDLSPIDLRRLNENQAGDQGFIRVRGEDFVHEKSGAPARFWAVNTGPDMVRRSKGEVDLFARTMARRGVNLVRLHGPIYEGSGPHFGRLDTNYISQLDYFVTALKREGIYSALSIYFPLWATLGPENTQFPGYTGKHPFALLYFDADFRRLYRGWWEYLLTHTNTHTGLALRDDPAVAMVELVNEDSLMFWTFNPDAGSGGNIPDAQRARWEKQFGDWLLARYPGRTLATIRSGPWSGRTTPQDNLAAGRVGFRSLWSLFNDRTPRDQDTARFLTETQLRFYSETTTWMKETLRVRALIYGSNWKTASPRYLDPLDKWSNAHADFFDRHGYFGGIHTGDASGYAIQTGQQYDDRSALTFRTADGRGDDFDLPLWDIIYSGQPSTISEVNWTPPGRFRSEYPVLAAITGASQGSDAIFHFAASAPAWDGSPGKFSVQTPAVMGQFPATAMIYRQGLLRTAPRVVALRLALGDLFALQGTPLPAPQNFDQLRGNDVPPGGTITNAAAIDSLAFLVGRVAVDFVTNGPGSSQVTDLSPFLNRTARTVRSATGELEWNWGLGLASVRAPAAQGAVGFLSAAGTIDLPQMTITSTLEYGSVLLVAFDGKPITESSRLLLQVMSEEKPYQWATDRPSGLRTITNVGQPPIMIRNLAGTVVLKRTGAAALRVTTLDFNGYRVGAPESHGAGIQLRPDRLYYLIEP